MVNGLSGTVIVQNNARDDVTITSNGPFAFATKMGNSTAYAVTVKSHPIGQTCWVSHGSGVVPAAAVTDVALNCVPKEGVIAFYGPQGLSVVKPDGSDLMVLAPRLAGGIGDFQWSPDATRFVFASGGTAEPLGPSNIWVLRADTGAFTQLTTAKAPGAGSGNPHWSPDGTRIVFESTRNVDGTDSANAFNSSNIWLVNADGTGLTALTKDTSNGIFCFSPQWSPDGTKIVFVADRPAANGIVNQNIWMMNADGSGQTALTTGSAGGLPSSRPQWSPDGTRIVFESHRDISGADAGNGNATANIWVVNSDGTALAPLTKAKAAGAASFFPRWSPDGTWVVFRSARSLDGTDATNGFGANNVWIVNADGSALTPLTNVHGGYEAYVPGLMPKWSSDGSRIVFQSHRNIDGTDTPNGGDLTPTGNIWVVKPDGTGLAPVTRATGLGNDTCCPEWSP